MACLLTQGFTLDCKDSVGGIKSIHLMNWSASKFTVASGEVTATTFASGAAYVAQAARRTAGGAP